VSTIIAAAALAIGADPAIAKKTKLDPGIKGCWIKAEIAEHPRHGRYNRTTTLCFGDRGRLRALVSGVDEGFESDGMYRGGAKVVQLLGFPGEGWPSRSPLERCEFGLADDKITLGGCGLAGEWKRECSKLGRDLECAVRGGKKSQSE
jgi:hypothetical protein